MLSVADLVEPNIIEELAQAANFRLGSRIYDADGVTFHHYADDEVVARVGGKTKDSQNSNEPRMVRLLSDGDKLSWKCSCTSDTALFCKHLVAAALATWDRVPADTA